MNYVCVFCGAAPGRSQIYQEAAKDLGKTIVESGHGLVYGGATVGLMGIIADEVLRLGGSVIGVIPEMLKKRELAHYGVTDLRIVGSMHERKALMADLSRAFVALPGGYGTLDEFCEILTWAQIGLHQKPMGLLNIAGYYDALIQQFDHGEKEGFVRKEHRQLMVVKDNPTELLASLSVTNHNR